MPADAAPAHDLDHHVSITMSGTVRVEVDGVVADIKSRRERAVLALSLIHI